MDVICNYFYFSIIRGDKNENREMIKGIQIYILIWRIDLG